MSKHIESLQIDEIKRLLTGFTKKELLKIAKKYNDTVKLSSFYRLPKIELINLLAEQLEISQAKGEIGNIYTGFYSYPEFQMSVEFPTEKKKMKKIRKEAFQRIERKLGVLEKEISTLNKKIEFRRMKMKEFEKMDPFEQHQQKGYMTSLLSKKKDTEDEKNKYIRMRQDLINKKEGILKEIIEDQRL